LLPQERAEGCEDEYRQVAFAIQTLMSPYLDIAARDKALGKNSAVGKLHKKTSRESQSK
jgi:hypothetical protein